MKTRKFALCLAAVFLVMIYINIVKIRKKNFTKQPQKGAGRAKKAVLKPPLLVTN